MYFHIMEWVPQKYYNREPENNYRSQLSRTSLETKAALSLLSAQITHMKWLAIYSTMKKRKVFILTKRQFFHNLMLSYAVAGAYIFYIQEKVICTKSTCSPSVLITTNMLYASLLDDKSTERCFNMSTANPADESTAPYVQL